MTDQSSGPVCSISKSVVCFPTTSSQSTTPSSASALVTPRHQQHVLQSWQFAPDLLYLGPEVGARDEHLGATILEAVLHGLRPECREERAD